VIYDKDIMKIEESEILEMKASNTYLKVSEGQIRGLLEKCYFAFYSIHLF
jgi:hypothetical protein